MEYFSLKINSTVNEYLIPNNWTLFVLRIVFRSYNCLLRIIICYLKPDEFRNNHYHLIHFMFFIVQQLELLRFSKTSKVGLVKKVYFQGLLNLA